ncbi:MAG TPA: Re/Si-specific NAD(P)(+) transhydrogenase subunit alpha [Acidimicrobiales bacterium]|nr:Re/Si-specific NAD(P)(+) transhydrogenase subunit alpha [Acidimicrobiales bacterium]
MKLAVIKESRPGETRVAIVPEVASKLVRAGIEIVVESGAGSAARFSDEQYREAGATVVPDAGSALEGASIVALVQPPAVDEVADLPDGVSLISFLQPVAAAETVRALAAKGATVYSLDLLPRISRAQSMDALSSQATVAGYRAGLSAAEHLAKFFPMFMTAAGTVPPAKVLVMGAGVAGLQAIATARRLGAVVRAYDVRAAAKEEVQSLGAKFVELDLETQDGAGGYAKEQSPEYLARQQELLATEVAASDVVITTAQIPGRRAPVLVTTGMVEGMSEGAVIIDMAADSGGNCELSVPGEDVLFNGVTVVGLTNPPASMPTHASFLYARNIANLLGLLVKDGELAPDFDDEIVAGTCVVRNGEVMHGPTAEALGLAPPESPGPPAAPPAEATAAGPAGDAQSPSKETPS